MDRSRNLNFGPTHGFISVLDFLDGNQLNEATAAETAALPGGSARQTGLPQHGSSPGGWNDSRNQRLTQFEIVSTKNYFTFSKSPAFMIVTFFGSKYLRMAVTICSEVSAWIFFSNSASQARVRPRKR